MRDPNPAAHALAHLREYLGQLKRGGLLADGVEMEDPKLWRARAELALEATRDPSERSCRTRRSIICCRWYLRKLPWRRTGAGHLIEFVTTTSRTRSRLARGMASHQHATERNPAGNRPRAGLSRRCWPSWASPSQRPASRTYGRDGRMSPTSIVVRRSAAFLPKTARPNIEPAPKRGSCAMRPNRQSFIACARRRWSV